MLLLSLLLLLEAPLGEFMVDGWFLVDVLFFSIEAIQEVLLKKRCFWGCEQLKKGGGGGEEERKSEKQGLMRERSLGFAITLVLFCCATKQFYC